MLSFERIHDGAGQFAPQAASGGVDPSTIAAAYPGTLRKVVSPGNAAAVAHAGGAAATALMVARKLRAEREIIVNRPAKTGAHNSQRRQRNAGRTGSSR